MGIAALVLSILAVLISLASVYYTAKADTRAERSEPREARRHELEEAAAAERRRGNPVALPRGGAGGPTADPVHHDYLVRNGGQATITGLWLWIEDGNGRTVSSCAGGEAVVLAPNDEAVFMGIDVRQPLPDEQTLMVRWKDPDGEHTEERGHPPLHA